MKKTVIFLVLLIAVAVMPPAQAQPKSVLYVPADDRPVSLEYVADTGEAAGVALITPPVQLLGSRTGLGDPDGVWEWLFSHSQEADAIVVSSDTLLYGSLVGSRVHHFGEDVLARRLANFEKLKQLNPGTPLYVFGTIMRTPKFSAGGVEPDYYEKYGPSIFQITALEDKRDLKPLTRDEQAELEHLTSVVPQAVMAKWMERRAVNYQLDVGLIRCAKDGIFDYLILGRDDASPYSQSHKESRLLAREAGDSTGGRYASFPGADQLGMLLVTRAVNTLIFQLPFVQVDYAPGAGPATIPTYEDAELGETIPAQIAAAGGVMLINAVHPDLILAVNTPENGMTLEANNPQNQARYRASDAAFAAAVDQELAQGRPVSVADVSFSNGADNALMAQLHGRGLLPKLAAYSGWNTASNTLGYSISQGMLAGAMTPQARTRLLTVRLLDDWAYQANIRGEIDATVLGPLGGNYFYLDNLAPRLTAETGQKLQAFAAANFPEFATDNLQISYPWNRMFEIDVKLKPPQK